MPKRFFYPDFLSRSALEPHSDLEETLLLLVPIIRELQHSHSKGSKKLEI